MEYAVRSNTNRNIAMNLMRAGNTNNFILAGPTILRMSSVTKPATRVIVVAGTFLFRIYSILLMKKVVFDDGVVVLFWIQTLATLPLRPKTSVVIAIMYHRRN